MKLFKDLLSVIYSIRVFRGELQQTLKKKIYLFLSYLIVRLFFLNASLKVKFCSIEALKKLNDKDIKKIGLAKDKGDLALKIIKDIDHKDKKMIEKLVWLISYDRYEDFSINYLIEYLQKFHFQKDELKVLINTIPTPFAEYGDYERFEIIMLWLRKELDKKYQRKIGIYNESSIFTSIGHMTLLVSLLKAIDLKIINKINTELDLVITRTQIANLEYSKLLVEKCNEMGINIRRDFSKSYLDLEPNLELWPTQCTNQYSYSRYLFGLIDGCWELKRSKKFLTLKKEQIKVAKNIFIRNYGEVPKDFVGVHFRVAKDSKTIRNTSKSSAIYALNILNQKSIKSILVGTKSNNKFYKNESFYNFEESNNILDTTQLNLSRFERECLQLYIWSKSRFFVGSLSGGTMPPGAFGIPIIWLDIHPQTHVRLPSKYDHIIPKQVFYKKEKRFLEFKELSEVRHIAAQSENSAYLEDKGYEVVSCKKEKIDRSFNDMILKTSKKNKSN